MTDFEAAAERLFDRICQRAGRRIVYRRLTIETEPLSAYPTAVTYEVPDQETGLPERITLTDWSLKRSALLLAGQLIEPRPGDRIACTSGGAAAEYEVLPVGRQPCSEWADAGGVLLTIHTKRIA